MCSRELSPIKREDEINTRIQENIKRSSANKKAKNDQELALKNSFLITPQLLQFLKHNSGRRITSSQLKNTQNPKTNLISGKIAALNEDKALNLFQVLIEEETSKRIVAISNQSSTISNSHETIFFRNLYDFIKPLQQAFKNEDNMTFTCDHTLQTITHVEVRCASKKRLQASPKAKCQEPNKSIREQNFSISLHPMSDFPERYIQTFRSAANFWENVIEGIEPSTLPDDEHDLSIMVCAVDLDGPDHVLAQAKPTNWQWPSLLPTTGHIKFDTADLECMARDDTLFDVMCHEIGHVLGIGTMWEEMGLLDGVGTDDPRFIGTQAMQTYADLMGLQHPKSVPVENEGGEGVEMLHWREKSFGNVLMTSLIHGPSNQLSPVTIAALQDMGYRISPDFNEAPNQLSTVT